MSLAIFIDTGMFYALQNVQDEKHPAAKDIIGRIHKGQYGQAFTSDYVVDEAVTLVHARTKNRFESQLMLDKLLNSPSVFEIINVTENDFYEAAHEYKKCDSLSFTDASTLALMRKHRISHLASFDNGFLKVKDIHVISR